MPPSPVHSWLAVVHSALLILDHALQYRAAQVTRGVESIRVSQSRQRGVRGGGGGGGVYEKTRAEEAKDPDEPLSSEPFHVQPSSLFHANEAWLRQLEIAATPRTPFPETVSDQQLRGDTTVASMLLEPSFSSTTVPGIPETRPPAAEPPPTRAADVNLSISDDAPVVDVRTPQPNRLDNFLYVLKPPRFYCRRLRRPGLNRRDTFSLPKCLLLASADFSTTEVFYLFIPTFFFPRVVLEGS